MLETRVKYGSDTKAQWDTEQGGGVYATSTLGQITGFGAGEVDRVDEHGNPLPYRFAGAIIIDDPIKPEDALSDVVRERVNRRFETTIRNQSTAETRQSSSSCSDSTSTTFVATSGDRPRRLDGGKPSMRHH